MRGTTVLSRIRSGERSQALSNAVRERISYRHANFDSIRKRVRTSNTADCTELFIGWIQQPTMADTGRSELLQRRQGADLQAKAEHGPGHPPLPALLCARTFHRGHSKRLSLSLLCPRLLALSLLDPLWLRRQRGPPHRCTAQGLNAASKVKERTNKARLLDSMGESCEGRAGSRWPTHVSESDGLDLVSSPRDTSCFVACKPSACSGKSYWLELMHWNHRGDHISCYGLSQRLNGAPRVDHQFGFFDLVSVANISSHVEYDTADR